MQVDRSRNALSIRRLIVESGPVGASPVRGPRHQCGMKTGRTARGVVFVAQSGPGCCGHRAPPYSYESWYQLPIGEPPPFGVDETVR